MTHHVYMDRRILTAVPQCDWKSLQDVLTPPGWPQWIIIIINVTYILLPTFTR